MNYLFYLQQTDKAGNPINNAGPVLLEGGNPPQFPGLSYLSCTGLETVGKPKNVYTEDYADNSTLRTYHPSDTLVEGQGGTSVPLEVTHAETKVELTVAIQGSNRRTVYNNLCSFLSQYRIYYWDTARHKKVWLILNDEVPPTDDTLKGKEFIRVTFKFTNLWGIGKSCSDDGTLL